MWWANLLAHWLVHLNSWIIGRLVWCFIRRNGGLMIPYHFFVCCKPHYWNREFQIVSIVFHYLLLLLLKVNHSLCGVKTAIFFNRKKPEAWNAKRMNFRFWRSIIAQELFILLNSQKRQNNCTFSWSPQLNSTQTIHFQRINGQIS